MVGGVPQWLGRRSLAGGLFLLYVWCWHVTTLWIKCPLWDNQPGQLSLRSLRVGKWVVIRVIMWITRVTTINRQTRAAYGWLVAGLGPWARAWPTAYRLCARSICNNNVLDNTLYKVTFNFNYRQRIPGRRWRWKVQNGCWGRGGILMRWSFLPRRCDARRKRRRTGSAGRRRQHRETCQSRRGCSALRHVIDNNWLDGVYPSTTDTVSKISQMPDYLFQSWTWVHFRWPNPIQSMKSRIQSYPIQSGCSKRTSNRIQSINIWYEIELVNSAMYHVITLWPLVRRGRYSRLEQAAVTTSSSSFR